MTLGELKAAILERAHRADLSSKVTEFIRLAEVDANRRMYTTYALADEADAASNVLSDMAPDVYLFGGLAQLALYTQDDVMLSKYSTLYLQAVETAHDTLVRDSGIHNDPAAIETGVPYTWDITTG